MIDLGPHAAFILWAYFGVGAAVIVLIAGAILSARRVEARLAALETRGRD